MASSATARYPRGRRPPDRYKLARVKWLRWTALPVGIAILIGMVVHEGVNDIAHVIGAAGVILLWLIPLHALPLYLDAYAWQLLLGQRITLPFLWWVATVREAVSRLLPVASIGGEIVGIRLAGWRCADISLVSATVIVEVLITMAVQYAFSALGIVLMMARPEHGNAFRTIVLSLLLTCPLPFLAMVFLRRGGIFHAIERWAARLLGDTHRLLQHIDGKRLDADIDGLMRQTGLLSRVFLWQLAGYVSGALETYLAMRWLGHPISIAAALSIEALSQAVRHAAFMVPGGVGVQEIGIVFLAQAFGVDREFALSLALVKRMREVVFGCLALLSWQLAEIMRLRWAQASTDRNGEISH